MKKRMTGSIFLALLSMMACTQPAQQPAYTSPHKWVFDITSHTTIHTIDSVMIAWKNDSIDLNFTKLEYDTLGRLIKIKGSVYLRSKGTPMSGTFSQDSLLKKPMEIKMSDRGVYIGNL